MSNSNQRLNRKLSVRDLLSKVKILKEKKENKETLRNFIFRKAEDTSFWVNDEMIDYCFSCNNQFTTFRRKHHCRLCGRIYCHTCTLHIPGSQFGFNGPVRICLECFRNIPKPIVEQGVMPVSLHRNSSVETFDVYSSDSGSDTSEPFLSFQNVNEPEVITYDLQLRRSASSRSNISLRRRSISSHSSVYDPNDMDDISKHHLSALGFQLFNSHLSSKIACDISWMASKMVDLPNVTDIREVIKIKSCLGGFQQSQVIDAYVFTKYIAHNRMQTSFIAPNILLVAFPLNFYKKEFTSLENLLHLEKEFLTKLVQRIASLGPNILICSDSVSRLVVDMLLQLNITLIYKVKLKVIKDISRITNADIITSIDRLALNPTLGTCGSFNVEMVVDYKSGNKKSLIFLKHCKSKSGCTILLHWPNIEPHSNVKKTLKYLILAAYSLRLEHSLLLDLEAHVVESTSCETFDFKSDNLIINNNQPVLSSSTITLDKVLELQALLYRKIEAHNNLISTSPNVHFGIPNLLNQYKHDLNMVLAGIDGPDTDIQLIKQFDRIKSNINSVLEMDFKPSPLYHLNIYVLFMASNHLKPPELLHIDYFTSTDTTLGQYIEDVVFESKSDSINKSYCHNNYKISVSSTKIPSGSSTPPASPSTPNISIQSSPPGVIEMYTICTLCLTRSKIQLMNDLTWKYSFGKYLELLYYNQSWYSCCDHNIMQLHDKYFLFDSCLIRFHTSKIHPFRVIIPDIKPKFNLQLHHVLKNQTTRIIKDKCIQFYADLNLHLNNNLASLISRINVELVEQCQLEFYDLIHKARIECATTLMDLQFVYKNSEMNDVNSVCKYMHVLYNKAEEWNQIINKLTLYLTLQTNSSTPTTNSPTTTPTTARLLKMIHDYSNQFAPTKYYNKSYNRYTTTNTNRVMIAFPKLGHSPGQHLMDVVDELESDILNTMGKIDADVDTDADLDTKVLHLPELGKQYPLHDDDDDVKPSSFMMDIVLDKIEIRLSDNEYYSPDSSIMILDEEITSVIAFGLNHKMYIEQLQAIPDDIEKDLQAFKNMMQSELEEDIPMDKYDDKLYIQHHARITENTGKIKLDLTIYYAKQFRVIRTNCEIETWYITSLIKSEEMKNVGGKSKSWFLKTLDERFIIKSLPRHEFEAFLRFAPFYFEYMSRATLYALPTVLAKIFGCYKINYKNTTTGQTNKLNVVVMENIFYNCKVNKIFDLKGSFRNRHVDSSKPVLYDENLIESMQEHPLFIREHAKKVIRASIWNDTLFLQSQNVMDYSILIGIVQDTNDLVIGVVDFIRTYTWDKKLETVFKEKGGSLIGENREPTIISPKQYKKRFRDCVEKYLLLLPDKYCNSQIQRTTSAQQIDAPE
eukprot:NODE_137_length_18042_cov_0.768823.p1 type:complete len:1367 gc:universal NODE_137_length_18042_cov_0.768823:13523-9423(-)